MNDFRLSNKRYTFHRQRPEGDYERIEIGRVPSELREIILEGLDEGVHKIKPSTPADRAESLAHKTSLFFHHHLPFDMWPSAYEFYKDGEQYEFFDEAYFFEDQEAQPHTLSQLYVDQMLNCNGQSIAIKEVLYSKEWGLYSLYNNNSAGGHHVVARIHPKGYCVRIDPSRGPARKKVENDVYVFPKELFFKRYVHTPFLSLFK